jgi:hypothetical protein
MFHFVLSFADNLMVRSGGPENLERLVQARQFQRAPSTEHCGVAGTLDQKYK